MNKIQRLTRMKSPIYVPIVKDFGYEPEVIPVIYEKLDGYRRVSKINRPENVSARQKDPACDFTYKEGFVKVLSYPYCYFFKTKRNLYDPQDWSVDHEDCKHNGGQSTLDNLKICDLRFNIGKLNYPLQDYVDFCAKVAQASGRYNVTPILTTIPIQNS